MKIILCFYIVKISRVKIINRNDDDRLLHDTRYIQNHIGCVFLDLKTKIKNNYRKYNRRLQGCNLIFFLSK